MFLRKLEELSFATKCIIAITIDAIADRQTSIYKNYCIGLDDRAPQEPGISEESDKGYCLVWSAGGAIGGLWESAAVLNPWRLELVVGCWGFVDLVGNRWIN